MRALWPFGRYDTKRWLQAAALFVVYVAMAQLAFYLYTAPAVVYPSAGIALAALVVGSIDLWPVILLAALFSYALEGSPLMIAIMLSFVHLFQALGGWYLLSLLQFRPMMRRFRDMLYFMGAILLSSTIGPSLGLLALNFNEYLHGGSHTITWGPWYLGMITSNLLVASFIMRWGAKFRFKRSWNEIIELVLIFGLLVTCSIALFWTPYTFIFGISLVYFLLIPLFWLALRSGMRFLTIGLIALSIIALTGTVWGPFAPHDPMRLGEALFQIEILLDILAIISLVIVSIEEERREAVNALSVQLVKLEDALGVIERESRAKTDFLAVLAHELRNPLAPVVSSIDLMRVRNLIHDDGVQVLEIMEGSLKTVRRLLDDLLDISRISQDKLPMQIESVHVGAVIRRAVRAVEPRMREHDQTLKMDLPKVPLMIDADPVRIEQVVTNLLVNASKFTPAGGSIYVEVGARGGMAEIHVRDSGIGIDPSFLRKIFDPFMQIDRGHAGQEGLGIGLALTQKLTEAHGGTIEAKSRGRGHGSDFVVRLPLTVSTRVTLIEMQRESEPEKRTIPRQRILIVDDNAAAARGIGALLEYDGHEVALAHSGKEAFAAIASFVPEVVILDIGLPDLSGYEVARALRQEKHFTGNLIALSGYGQEDDKKRAIESGFDVHLTKPIGINDLRAALLGLKA